MHASQAALETAHGIHRELRIGADRSEERRVFRSVSTRKAMAISFGLRPDFSANPCMRARPLLKRLTVFIGNCGLVPTDRKSVVSSDLSALVKRWQSRLGCDRIFPQTHACEPGRS